MIVRTYIEANQQRFLDELFEWLRIPSISANSNHKSDVRKAAEFLMRKLEEAGASAELLETEGHPIVFAEKMIDQKLPTVLVYGHYDVQPPDPLDLWTSPPFEPQVREGKIYARGACDDKGQVYMHVKALEILNHHGTQPCNIKFIIEGEEEVGSDHLADFVRTNKDRLKADILLISDTAMLSLEHPSITTGLRGLSYIEVEVTGPNRDLHSGVYGGAVTNPINALCQMISKLHDGKGRVTVPGFYDDVKDLTAQERSALNQAPFDLKRYKEELGIGEINGEEGYSTIERTGIRPTLDVNGIWGGYTGEGAKTVLPSKAYAKISMRLVPAQRSADITEKFIKYFKSLAPAGVTVKISPLHGGEPAVTPTESKGYTSAKQAFEDVWGKSPIPTRDGGSIPVVALFKKELNLDTVLMGFGLDSDAIHSPDEHYGVTNFTKGIETIVSFYKFFSQGPGK